MERTRHHSRANPSTGGWSQHQQTPYRRALLGDTDECSDPSSSDPGRPGCHQLLSIAMLHGAAGRRSRASGGAGDGCHSRTRCNVHRLSGLVGRGPARHDSSLTGRCLVRCTLPCWGEGSEMGTNVNAARVIYESFAAGDIGAFLAALDDRVEWVYPDGAAYDTQVGPPALAENVLAAVARDFAEFTATVDEYIDGGDVV